MKIKILITTTVLAVLTFAIHPALAENDSLRPDKEEAHISITPLSWEEETIYWHKNYPTRPYYNKDMVYSMVEPAYQYGYDAYRTYKGRSFDEIDDAELASGWEKAKGTSPIAWEDARNAARDCYNRISSRYTHVAKANIRK